MGRLLLKGGSLPPNERPPPLQQWREHSSTTLQAQAGLYKVVVTYLGSLVVFLIEGRRS
jgi:hypothetical protein